MTDYIYYVSRHKNQASLAKLASLDGQIEVERDNIRAHRIMSFTSAICFVLMGVAASMAISKGANHGWIAGTIGITALSLVGLSASIYAAIHYIDELECARDWHNRLVRRYNRLVVVA